MMSYEVYRMKCIEHYDSIEYKPDAFICFKTREDRAYNALLAVGNYLTDAVIISFEETDTSTIAKDIRKLNIPISFIQVDKDLSAGILPCLRELNRYVLEKEHIGIDISCMPIPFFAQLLHFLFTRHSNKIITIYYTEPAHYTLKKLFDYSAYNGEIDIKTVPGFEGETSHFNEIKRVVFYLMGFEMSYLNNLIPQDVNPNKIAPINGFPAYYPKYKDISLINNNTDFYQRDIDIIYSEANNPFKTYNTMVMLADKYSGYRIDIIPVGPKPMALGACLYALKNGNNSCRIIFPFPSEYKLNQSTGSGKLWEFRL